MEEALTREPALADPDDVAPMDRIAVDPSAIPRFVEVLARVLVARALREEIAQNVSSCE